MSPDLAGLAKAVRMLDGADKGSNREIIDPWHTHQEAAFGPLAQLLPHGLVEACDLVLQLTPGLQHRLHDPGNLGLIRHEGLDPLGKGTAMGHSHYQAKDLQST
jgi:hypothetical protein